MNFGTIIAYSFVQYWTTLVTSSVSYWRYELGSWPNRRLEVGTWFDIECTRQEWANDKLSWYFEEPWCEIYNSRLQRTQARCNMNGAFGFGVVNGTSVKDYKILKVYSNKNYFGWHAVRKINRSGDNLIIDLRLKITESNAYFQNNSSNSSEHSIRLTRLFNSKGETPKVEFKQNLKSSLLREVTDISFDHINGEWLMSFAVPVDSNSVRVSKHSSSRYSLFDKFIRPAEYVMNTWQTPDEVDPLMVESLLSGPIQHPCMPDVIAYISSTGIAISEGFTQNILNFSTVLNVGEIDSAVFLGHRVLFVKNQTLFFLEKNGTMNRTGLSRNDVTAVYTPNLCSEVSSQQRTVVSLADNNMTNSIYSIFASFDGGYTFSMLNTTHLEDAFGYNVTKGMLILDVHIHSVFNRLTLLVNSTMASKANSVLIDYSFTTKNWTKLYEFDQDNVTRFAFPLSTSNNILLWSDDALFSFEGNKMTAIFDLKRTDIEDTESKVKDVVSDKNGQFVVQLNSGELFAGMIGVGKLTKISSIDPACSLLYDSIGQLIILRSEEYKNNVSSFIYPLHAEIDSAVDMGACELVSFSTDIVGGWYQIDVGEHINIKAELISESSNTSIMIAFPPHSNLKASVEETADSIGKYFKKTRTIDVFVAENSSTIQRFGDIYTTIVIYPSNLTPICSRAHHQTAFFHLGCPSSRHLNLNRFQKCAETVLSAKLKPFVTTENYLDSPAYCTVVLNRNQLDLETYLSQQDSIFRRANEEVVVRELTGRSDFYFALDPNAIVNGHLNYSFIFEGDGEYIFIVSLDSKVSFCHLSAYLIVTRELMPEAQNSLAVTISVCLGISFSIIYLAVSFLRYRHNTILEHIKEAEIVKRKQELRYLSNLYDLKGSEGSGVSSRRKSSVLKEGIRKRNISLSAISEMSAEI
ncbi:uncharacterized protein LOC135692687 isoform X2 [Rhopilema esculentum]|uniref:uncharacterized protein LOC135692687 isoform X2 n=1 Tax=Rhopilema esculentum TaxID=499914 RepID=UPI0031E13CEE